MLSTYDESSGNSRIDNERKKFARRVYPPGLLHM